VNSPAVEPLALFAALLVFCVGGVMLMSRLAGWHVLGNAYPMPLRLQGEQYRFSTIKIGTAALPITYRNCVRVVLTDDGLGLCLMVPFRFYSPPFLVPWSAVTACTETQFLATRKVTLAFAGSNRQVTLAGPLGQLVKAKWAAQTGREA
jgi:hypothetical protein